MSRTVARTWMTALTVIVGGALAVAPVPQASAQTGGGIELGTEYDCVHSCNDCQKACESKPAGSARSDCMRGCSASAGACCSGYGKKPPQGLSCACMQ